MMAVRTMCCAIVGALSLAPIHALSADASSTTLYMILVAAGTTGGDPDKILQPIVVGKYTNHSACADAQKTANMTSINIVNGAPPQPELVTIAFVCVDTGNNS